MRTYYGEAKDLTNYIENETHKVAEWTDTQLKFRCHKLINKTQFTLIVSESRWRYAPIINTVKPHEVITIMYDERSVWNFKVIAQEDNDLKCSFRMEYNRMEGRNYDETKRDFYIVPVFKSGNVEIITSKECGADLGIVPKYTIKPIESPERVLKIKNYTKYNVIISIENQVVQRIESRQTAEVAIPFHAVLYVDTETEEVLWEDWLNNYKKEIISVVNGCCIEITGSCEPRCHHLYGPGITAQYVHYLYASSCSSEDNAENIDINIWCHVFDED